jgi:hypothetical protein
MAAFRIVKATDVGIQVGGQEYKISMRQSALEPSRKGLVNGWLLSNVNVSEIDSGIPLRQYKFVRYPLESYSESKYMNE